MNALITHFDEHAEFTGVRDDDREGWLALRKTMLTASDAAALFGVDPRKDALTVYADKVTERKAPEDVGIDSPMWWGKVLEQPILSSVAAYHGWDYHRGGALLRSRKHPWLGCTLDAEFDRGQGWEDMEGKTSQVPMGWDEDAGEMPTKILIQVQHQLLVTGAQRALVFALLQGARPCMIDVDPSPSFHARLIEVSEEFMDRVKRLDAPDVTWKSKTALERLYPKEEGHTVNLPDKALIWTRQLQKISETEGRLKKRSDELKNELRKSIGDATFGLLPDAVGGKSCWKWCVEHKDEYVVRAQDNRILRALKEHPAEKKSRSRRRAA